MKAADTRDTSRRTERLLAAIHEAKDYAEAHEGVRVTLAVSDLGWLLERITALEDELRKQWESNHAEHCQLAWPHEGDCHWPPPAELTWHRGGHEA